MTASLRQPTMTLWNMFADLFTQRAITRQFGWRVRVLSLTTAGSLAIGGCAQGGYELSSRSCDGYACAVASVAPRSAGPAPPVPAAPPPPAVAPPPRPVLEAIPVTGAAPTAAQRAAAARARALRLAEEKRRAESKQANAAQAGEERTRQLMAARKEQLKPAVLAWNTPPKMSPVQTASVELRISRNATGPELKERIASRGATTTTDAPLADNVTATLVSQGFDISAATPMTQNLLPEGDTNWMWSIRPKAASKGTQTLVLTVNSTLGDVGTASQSLTRDIYVEVAAGDSDAWLDFLKSDWSKLWSLLILPAGAVVAAWFRRRRVAAADTPLPRIL